jgi:hypothetical protein
VHLGIQQTFAWKWMKWVVTSRKAIDRNCCQWYNSNFQVKIRILENSYQHQEPIFKDFSKELTMTSTHLVFSYWMMKYLEDPWMHVLWMTDTCCHQALVTWVREPFHEQDRSVGFQITKCESFLTATEAENIITCWALEL